MHATRSSHFFLLRAFVALACASTAAQAGGECAPQWVSLAEGPMAIDGNPGEAVLTVGPESRFGPAFYTIGAFTLPGQPRQHGIVRWDESGWSVISIAPYYGYPYAMLLHGEGEDEAIYFGGRFHAASGGPFGSVARWDGVELSIVPDSHASGDPLGILAMTSHSNNGQRLLVVSGEFSAIGATPASNIAAWDGDTWTDLGAGLIEPGDAVLALTSFDDGSGPAVYASGWFTDQIGDRVSRIARWRAGSWEHIGYDLNSHANDFVIVEPGGVVEPGLYAGGSFTIEGDPQHRHVARWNGAGWDPVGELSGWKVRDLEVLDDGKGKALFATGSVKFSDISPTSHLVVKWDGTQWVSLGAEAGQSEYGYLLGAFPGTASAPPALFVHGEFDDSPAGDAEFAAWQGCILASCPGDTNGDNIVNFTDLNAVLADFGASGSGLPGDLDGDGTVNFTDLNLVLAAFGNEC